MENLNTVDAVTEEVVTLEETEQAEVVESVESEVATDTPTEEVVEKDEKPVQSKEENSKFAEVRKKAEQAAQDKLISEMYGESHGIHTKAEYDKAIAKQKENELLERIRTDSDPDTVKQELYKEWEKNDPRLQEYEKIKVESRTNEQLTELNTELANMGLDAIKSLDDISVLPSADTMIDMIQNGKTLAEAYFLANKADIIKAQAEKVKLETITKLNANGEGPGSLADNGKTATLFTRAQVDAMSQDDVNKNYDLIMKSMKTWK